jgi:putative NADPH-quinone reductase
MSKRIAIIQGHPDATREHFGHVLERSYAEGSVSSGHEIKQVRVAELDFPLLRSKDEWETMPPVPAISSAQETIAWAHHLIILFPLWLGTMPALFKAFLEQTLRPGFAFTAAPAPGKKLLIGKSARVVITMGMPAFIYRWYFFAHGLRGLERNILGFTGVSPIRSTMIGMIESENDSVRQQWLAKMFTMGGHAS